MGLATVLVLQYADKRMVIVCLDMSKAFDRVSLYGLAVKLINRNLP